MLCLKKNLLFKDFYTSNRSFNYFTVIAIAEFIL